MVEKTNEIIKIYGKIDANNAKQFETELFVAVPEGDITIDAEELEYVSSAGLRVFLKLKKQTGKEVSVINVSPEVYDIFDVTGFNSILNVKKALRSFSVDGLELIGRGATGCVYRIDKETIIKVFNENVGLRMINNEGKKAKDAFIFGVPTAISYDIVKVGDRYGVIYELLNAEDLLNVVRNDKTHIEEYIRNFAVKMREMHTIEVDDRFGDIKEDTIKYMGFLVGKVCTEEEVEKMRAVVRNVPDRNSFIHGDAHIGNVMLQNGEYMFIDLSTAGKGHPIFDMVSMCLGFKMSQLRTAEQREAHELTRGFTAEELQLIWHTYLKSYFAADDESFIKKAEEQIIAISCARTILAAIAIPGLFPPERLEYFKNTVVAYYDKGMEPVCF